MRVALGLAAWLTLGCASSSAPRPPSHPVHVVVAAADVRAVEAGLSVLTEGGSAVDAALATSFVLGLVEPQSSGLGGGGFLVHYDSATRRLESFDGREVAPAAIDPDVFVGPGGSPIPFRDAQTSGAAIGVPGLVPMLLDAHSVHGRLPVERLVAPAIALAEGGFAVTERMAGLLADAAEDGRLAADPDARALLFDDAGRPVGAGAILHNPAYADTLRRIVSEGARGLLAGPVAEAIVAEARAQPRQGSLSLEDLASYTPRRFGARCAPHRSVQVCGFGGAASGTIPVLQILSLYERLRPAGSGATPDDWAAYAWSSRLAFADRNHYLGDESFVEVPPSLLDPAYLDQRAQLVALERAPDFVAPGDPPSTGTPYLERWGRDRTHEVAGTSHLSVLDADGNAVVLTQTIEAPFGSLRMTHGFFLNNELTDFALVPTAFGGPVANAVAGGKRPRSSMAPTFVLDREGRLLLAIGSPGGSGIIGYVALTLIGVLDWGLTLDAAIELPHMTASGPVVRAELDRMAPEAVEVLRARGFRIEPTQGEVSGLYGFDLRAATPRGGDDSRRPGLAAVRAISP